MAPTAGSTWVSHRTATNRPYWYNQITKQSVWEKPEELKSDVDKDIDQTPWRERLSGDKSYWVNVETRTSTWAVPDAVIDIAKRHGVWSDHFTTIPGHRPNTRVPSEFPQLMHKVNQRGHTTEYRNAKEAETAFIDMLAEKNVDADWTWEKTIRECITHPAFKAFHSNADKKQVFEKYVEQLSDSYKEQKEYVVSKNRSVFHAQLKNMGFYKLRGPKYYWAWPTARYYLERHCAPRVWEACAFDDVRKTLWDEAVDEVRKKDVDRLSQQDTETTHRAVALVYHLLGITGYVRGKEPEDIADLSEEHVVKRVLSKTDWASLKDAVLRNLDAALDPVHVDWAVLLGHYSRIIERAYVQWKEIDARETQDNKIHSARARADFVALLRSLVDSGKIHAGSLWKETVPLVRDADSYKAVVRASDGSVPLDLFFEVVDGLEGPLEDDLRTIRHSKLLSSREPASEGSPNQDSPDRQSHNGQTSSREESVSVEAVSAAARDAGVDVSQKAIELAVAREHFQRDVRRVEKALAEERDAQQRIDTLRYELRTSGLNEHASFSQAQEAMRAHAAFHGVDEDTQRRVYDAFMEKVQGQRVPKKSRFV